MFQGRKGRNNNLYGNAARIRELTKINNQSGLLPELKTLALSEKDDMAAIAEIAKKSVGSKNIQGVRIFSISENQQFSANSRFKNGISRNRGSESFLKNIED